MRLHIDFETFSEVDIKTRGIYNYAVDPSTEVLCMAYAFGDEPVELILPGEDLPQRIIDHIKNGGEVAGHNVFFEYAIWNKVCSARYDWPRLKLTQLVDTAAKAAYHSLPRDLAGCAKALSLIEKDESGRRIMLKLSKPRKSTKNNPATRFTPDNVPDDFQKLYDYCIQDVEVERAIDHFLPDLSPEEQFMWQLDAIINSTGILVDTYTVNTICDMASQYKTSLEKEAVTITGGIKTSQRDAILKWCEDQGYPLPGYTAAIIKKVLEDPNIMENVKRVLQIRRELSLTSVKKYDALRKAVSPDGRLRGMFLYYGASTGRWSGRVVQLHNLPRGTTQNPDIAIETIGIDDFDWFKTSYPDVMSTFSSCIRGMLMAPDGKELIVVDYSGIEARMVQFLAKDEAALDVFRKGLDTYKDMASTIFGVPYNEVNKEQRFVGKLAILGLGYQMGIPKFRETCKSWGNPISQDLAERTVTAYRKKYKRLKTLWNKMEQAARKATQFPGSSYRANDIVFIVANDFLFMELPSGRRLSYYQPKIEKRKVSWSTEKVDQITFMGIDTYTRKWSRTSTYAGKLVENATQAVSRDILAHALIQLHQNGYRIVLHCHDEIVVEVDEDSTTVEEIENIMCDLPDWAKGAPIEAEGFTTKRYRK